MRCEQNVALLLTLAVIQLAASGCQKSKRKEAKGGSDESATKVVSGSQPVGTVAGASPGGVSPIPPVTVSALPMGAAGADAEADADAEPAATSEVVKSESSESGGGEVASQTSTLAAGNSPKTAGKCLDPDLAQVAATVTLTLCDGSTGTGTMAPRPADCATDGSIGCVTVPAFRAASMAAANPANIRFGATVAGVAGAFPSATHRLDGGTDTADLDLATFDARIKSAASFEWFDSEGKRYTYTGDADIAAASIADGVSIFGTAGTHQGGSECSADGESNCFIPTYDAVTNKYRAGLTTNISEWDLRGGKVLAGVTGKMTFHKNMADLATFDRQSGAGAGMTPAIADPYDTIDDFNGGHAFPTQSYPGSSSANGDNWQRDAASDTGVASAGDGACQQSEDCVMIDRTTALSWSRDDGTARLWDDAIAFCDGRSYGTYDDWRLPTQKELMQAYADGIWSQRSGVDKLNLTTGNYYWTSSTYSPSPAYAWQVFLSYGFTANSGKESFPRNVTCVRP